MLKSWEHVNYWHKFPVCEDFFLSHIWLCFSSPILYSLVIFFSVHTRAWTLMWGKNYLRPREILVGMVMSVTPGHWKFGISVCIILEHLKMKYCDNMPRLWDKTISQLKSSKMKVWELSLVFTLSRRNATHGNKFLRSLSPKLKSLGALVL